MLIFGSQFLNFDEYFSCQVRSAILERPSCSWVLSTIDELPNNWDVAQEAIPKLQSFPGRKYLEDLRDWLRTGIFAQISYPLPNTVLTPLVVISHLVQYSRFLDHVQPNFLENHDITAAFKHTTEVFGLCTGLLSAAAVSCSSNQTQLQNFGSKAVNLAMLIGGLVDAQEELAGDDGRSRSLSVSWSAPAGGRRLSSVLTHFHSAYVSVLLDENRATITTDKSSVLPLQQELATSGITSTNISLRGRFHNRCHIDDLDLLVGFCNSRSAFQLPDASQIVFPTRSDFVNGGTLHDQILRLILLEQSDWRGTFAKIHPNTSEDDKLVFSFGPESCMPYSLVRKLGPRFIQLVDPSLPSLDISANGTGTKGSSGYDSSLSENGIAVVGMSCKLPGANNLEEFWESLCAAESQHTEIPSEGFRFNLETTWRDIDPKRKWYGNFIRDFDSFDHKFFQKSPREMSSTDPQHRLILQAAYQAVEQSGYFNRSLNRQDKHVGCYVGVGLVDYENNIACTPANAYSATGNLKSFAAGKISHYFGWTGPGLTIDTACSSSAVAVHSACRAILSGECTAALAGGVNIMTSFEWFQNLAGASFLSPSGQCKPFDGKADGYCRGEGVGAVFLKRLSSAVADGDHVLGVIGSSGTYQNQNCTPITVPNEMSLSSLFNDSIRRSGLEARQITYVEAHGTGTPVGDPAEYQSIRQVLGGSNRVDTLSLGSVKGLVGHTESASGIVALIKVLLMIHKRAIPPQASFQTMNPSINAAPSDRIEIATSIQPWTSNLRAALINNYGASGSNACLVVVQPPQPNSSAMQNGVHESASIKYPFWFCANDVQSLRAYSAQFRTFLTSDHKYTKDLSIANVAFQLSRQSNRSLTQALIFSCCSSQDLAEHLFAFERESTTATPCTPPPSRPVILCFGGQVSTFIGLDHNIFGKIKILRHHLNRCNSICLTLGLDGIYPEIFERSPIEDVVKLQSILFAFQYSCAKCWIDCGVQVAAVVGFSFGELTALCISGVISLHNAFQMVANRARLIRDKWGAEKGAMLAVEARLEVIESLIAKLNEPTLSIACFNGPTNFTLAGSNKAIDAIFGILTKDPVFATVRTKKLQVTNAFHSALVEPLVVDLKQLGQGVRFHEPNIPLEQALEFGSTMGLSADFVADHMRKPVYYHHAVQRLLQRYGDSIWLEAGSNSTITTITSRALGMPNSSHFQPINITTDSAFQSLAETTAGLWKEGLDVSFWAHHPSQSSEYDHLLLPPYQFEKSRHWIELKKPFKKNDEPIAQNQLILPPKGLWTFVGYQDKSERSVRFRVNITSQEFQDLVSGHVVAQAAPLCPSTLQLSIVIDALMSINPDSPGVELQPQAQGMTSYAPMILAPSNVVWLDAENSDTKSSTWDWKMTGVNPDSTTTLHCSGRIVMRSSKDSELQNEFSKYERLINRDQCQHLLNDPDVDELLKGHRIYSKFAEIVDYSDDYRGVQKIVGRKNTSAGYVVKTHDQHMWLNLGLADSFCQIAGIFVNCMTDRPSSHIYISDRIDQWIRSPSLGAGIPRPNTWEVFATHFRPSNKEFISDVFIFDPQRSVLVEAIIGIHYQLVPKMALAKVLSKVTSKTTSQPSNSGEPKVSDDPESLSDTKLLPATQPPMPKNETKDTLLDISRRVKEIIVNLSGLEFDQINDDSDLVELGIDSLMGMELAREIEIMFKCTLEVEQLNDITNFRSLTVCVQKTLSPTNGDVTDGGLGTKGNSFQASSQVDGVSHNNGDTRSNGISPTEISIQSDEHRQCNGNVQPHDTAYSNGNLQSKDGERATALPTAAILETFRVSKQATDQFISQFKLGGYSHDVLPKSTELCVVHVIDAFEELGCSLRNAKVGQKLHRIQYLPKYQQFVDFLYDLLENEAHLIDIVDSKIIRTTIPAPKTTAQSLFQSLVHSAPDHVYDHELTYLAGTKLADCLTGKIDPLQLIFGSPEGRHIVSNMYGKSPINLAWVKQMEEFLKNLLSQLSAGNDEFHILEMGAGTGGTTAILLPLLASLDVQVRYTVTELSPSLVAAARKRFKEYPFVDFRVLDIEKEPKDLLHSQHIVVATNCVHATHNLTNSTRNIHQLLRPDGFLMMLEMTQTLPWIDLVFGLLEGWWLFNDGRHHALVSPSRWQKTLQSVGYGHVDWTEGQQPESNIQRVIIALASASRYDRAPIPLKAYNAPSNDLVVRQGAIDAYVQQHTRDFVAPLALNCSNEASNPDGKVVLVTGATGSLGSHLVAYLIEIPSVKKVICLNRQSSMEPEARQQQAFKSRGIFLGSQTRSKLKVVEADAAKPLFGLRQSQYENLYDVTDILHNAWPMSVTRGINSFASQFKVMENLIKFACEVSSRRIQRFKVGFQFVSSIATVGYYPCWTGSRRVPEENMGIESVLPSGYGDAKLTCEKMLEKTLVQYPDQFCAMVVRIGQIAGSTNSGYWNPVEHFAFLIKSAQTLKSLPDLQGVRRPCRKQV